MGYGCTPPIRSIFNDAPAIPTALRGQGGQVAVASGRQTRGHPWSKFWWRCHSDLMILWWFYGDFMSFCMVF